MKYIKNHGLMSRDHCEIWGHNCKLDEVQAALLRIQLRKFTKGDPYLKNNSNNSLSWTRKSFRGYISRFKTLV